VNNNNNKLYLAHFLHSSMCLTIPSNINQLYAFLKRKVFNSVLKVVSFDTSLMWSGRAFQRRGPATENDLAPYCLFTGGSISRCLDDERSDLEGV